MNVLTYVPLNPLFMYIMGAEEAKQRRPTPAELAEMCRLLEVGMEAGACGFSVQKLGVNSHQRDYDGTPMITDTIAEDDLMAFAKVLKKLGRGVIQGIGAPGKTWENLAEFSGRPVIYNTVSPMADQHGVSNGRAEDVIAWLHECNAHAAIARAGPSDDHRERAAIHHGGLEFVRFQPDLAAGDARHALRNGWPSSAPRKPAPRSRLNMMAAIRCRWPGQTASVTFACCGLWISA